MKARKAISSVIGAVFAIIALSTTVGYVTYSMNILDNYNQSILVTNANALDRSKEQVQVSGVTIDSSKFNITANNIGNIPVHLTRLWVTNTTDVGKVFRYNIDYNLAPGQSQIKIGQNLPIYAKTSQAYDIKLITDRGTVKEFNVNSVGTAPLNIQLLALPPSVPSGFKTEFVMTVTNNGTSTITNLVPTLMPVGTPTATCVPDLISSPSNYATLTPGSTAVFSWAVKVTGTQDGQSCTYQAQLQNGYANNFAQATITDTIVTLSSTNYAASAGVVTNDYTSFRWTQGNTWKADWSIPSSGTSNDFQTIIANNNQTAGGYSLWLSKQSQIVLVPTFYNGNSVHPPSAFYLVQSIGLASGQGCSSPYPCIVGYTDYSTGISNLGGTGTIYFGASNAGGTSQTGSLAAGNYYGFIILYGKFCKNAGDNNCGNYAQTIPFYAIVAT